MEKKAMHKKRTTKKVTATAKKPRLSIEEMNAYAKEYFKTHEVPEHLKTVVGSVKAGNKTIKQLMLD